jgi:hypothetical protein
MRSVSRVVIEMARRATEKTLYLLKRRKRPV